MKKYQLSNVVIGLALMVTAAWTAHQALATPDIVVAGSLAASLEGALNCPVSDMEWASSQAVYLPEANSWWPRSEAGFTGREGGLLGLLDC
jgi:hypothetical protein